MKTTIQKKISIGIAILILILIFIGNAFVYKYFYDLVTSHRKQLDREVISQYSMEIQRVLQDTKLLAQNIAIDPVIQDFLHNENKNYYDIESAVQQIKNSIKLRLYIRSGVLVCDDEVYWSYSPYDSYFKNLLEERWYQDIKDYNGIFSETHPIKISIEKDYITYKCDIYDNSMPTIKIGELLLNLELQQFIDLFQQGGFNNYQHSLVFNEKNESIVFYHGDIKDEAYIDLVKEQASYLQPNESCTIDYMGGYITLQNLDKFDWTIALYTPKETIFKDVKPIQKFFLFYTPISVLAVTLAIYVYIRQLTKPISDISSAMLEFANGNKPKLSIKTGDELEILSDEFNHMVLSIDEYIKEKVRDERINKKIKFDMLMSKIHPHFLYNTLGSVIYLARRNGDIDIETMVKSLILILQDGMAAYSGQISAPLSTELSVVEAYGAIQKYRYKNKFEILYSIDDQVKEAYLPKNILQPLVENAIYHGIAPMKESGTVEISAELEDNLLRICISDNGVGMDEETLEIARNSIKTSTGGVHSIGINSIMDRLEYLYHDEFSFEIYSEEGKGTIALICIPYSDKPVDSPLKIDGIDEIEEVDKI